MKQHEDEKKKIQYNTFHNLCSSLVRRVRLMKLFCYSHSKFQIKNIGSIE